MLAIGMPRLRRQDFVPSRPDAAIPDNKKPPMKGASIGCVKETSSGWADFVAGGSDDCRKALKDIALDRLQDGVRNVSG